ncbi:metalloprotease PmbA [Kushneria phosphatilytica]|uniref:Metalloprotease PmbA n=1 Tax=Kushneria phosphatilytica TaxID=657387 RepID=A0A1S1NSN3_9GAMM|nr:metalloprotease PmbA [Kushneria phosphatilytica]OHV12259.1 metalloprotease PmbA [Kushneria phosphatilytica]QEL11461.1 metalloprotease PmbA [Kushneria phosphatilytica]
MSQAFDAQAQRAELEARVRMAIDHASRRGADACEIGAGVQQGVEVAIRHDRVETLEMARDQGIGVTVYIGQRKGSASTSDASESALYDAIDRACEIARYTGEDPAAGLADAKLMARDLPDLELYHPWALSTDEAIELARRCEQAGCAVNGIDSSDGATLSSSEGVTVYGNSHGFIGSQLGTQHSLSCIMIARDSQGMQRDHDYTAERDPSRLRDPEAVGRKAAERAMARLDAGRPETGRMPVLFVPELASGLIGSFLNAIAGGAIYRNASFLCDALGERLFPEWLSIGERPREPRAMASAAFDSDGVYTRDNDYIRDGRLESYMLSVYSARRLGMATTGNAGGARNVRLQAELTPWQTLLNMMGNGVIVTELMGQGVNAVTGDYSRGAAGFRVIDGQMAGPIEEFTIAGNLRDMFAGLRAIGNDIDTRGSVHTGSWLIDDMMVAG